MTAAGIEPTCRRSERLILPIPAANSGTPDHKVSTAGFEPAVSCSRSTRQYQAFLRPVCQRAPSGSRTRTFAMARRQAAATSWARCGLPDCQRSRAPGGSRTHVAALRVRGPCHWTTSAWTVSRGWRVERREDSRVPLLAALLSAFSCSLLSAAKLQWDQRDLNPHLAD